jgi:DNA primase/energy-coupling factor transporter ATP-binding protein EcfA2
MEIKDIKATLTLAEVIKHYGYKADKYNRINCPFHNDKTPSMQLYWKTHTAYCFSANCTTHGKSLDVIDFIMNMEKSNKHEAIKKAESLLNGNATPPTQELTRTAILTKMFTYFKNSVHNSKPARDYIESRNLDYTKLEIGYNTGQFHHGTRKEEALIQSCLKVGLLSPFGNNTRTGGQAYKPFAKECICFALRNRAGQITGLYFRSTINNKDSRHFYLKDRQGLYPYYPKPETKKLILAESIIDTATLLQNEEVSKEYNLLALYGTNGLTEEHTEAVSQLKELEEVIFFLNGDEAGRKATAKHAETLRNLKPEIKITSVNVPENEDVNSLAQPHEPGIFTHLLEKRSLFFSNEPGAPAGNKSSDEKKNPATSNALDTSNPFKIIFTTETAIYYIQGGIRSEADSMKVTLVIENISTRKKSRNKLDLYEDKQIEKTAREAGEKLQLRSDLIEADISELVDHLDHYRESREPQEGEQREETIYPLTALERKQAEDLLKAKDFFTKLNELIGKAGVVGEEQTRLFLFVIASSYRMPDTLHALVQGSSGSGKTHLIVKIAQLMPPENVKFLTRVTESSFYNYGEYELKNTLFCMEDLDGLKEEAFLAFRELQSREQLTSSTSEKDEKGNIRARIRTVKGPIASLSATTKGEVYEDNMSRSFLVSVDESPEQTQRIIEYQNRKASGQTDREEEKRISQLLRNCIRIVEPLQVINPYAGQITLPEEAHKIRRLNDLYQSFVRQVTLLNQYKRKKDDKGRLIAEKEDLEQASEIMFDSIMLKVDELDGSLRQFYERLKVYVQSKGKEYKNYAFGRKEIRDALRVSKSQQHRFFNDLCELEYIAQLGGNSHSGYKYKILVWDDMQALRARIKRYLQGQLNQLDLFSGVPERSKKNGTPNEKEISKLSNGVPNGLEHQS